MMERDDPSKSRGFGETDHELARFDGCFSHVDLFPLRCLGCAFHAWVYARGQSTGALPPVRIVWPTYCVLETPSLYISQPAFVTYTTEDAARAAAREMNDQELDGRRIRVDLPDASGGKGGKGGRAPRSLSN